MPLLSNFVPIWCKPNLASFRFIPTGTAASFADFSSFVNSILQSRRWCQDHGLNGGKFSESDAAMSSNNEIDVRTLVLIDKLKSRTSCAVIG